MEIKSGDFVFLLSSDNKTFLVRVKEDRVFGTHLGNVPLKDAIGKRYGEVIHSQLGKPFILLEPTLEDKMMKVRRLTQIIYPKDAALILLKAGIRSGMRVIGCGAGSGALTMALASAVAPTGRVYTYDRREDFLENARRNVEEAGFSDFVEFKLREVGEGFDERDVDVVLLDLPSPWEGVPAASRSLRGGGRIASLSPTYNQVEQTVSSLTEHGFVYLETVEVLVRRILVRPGRTRPYERMVSHTGFLTFGRRAITGLDLKNESAGGNGEDIEKGS
ncbi:MAG TPA: tRNA (adenine-N1)-methyltransferase [Thermodesulfobacteriota bacterium]|nr:tRNA (adenine-N1)-methyltransferase [Thermodesulfobacteriota bacterium]